MHEEKLKLLDVVDKELVEAVRQKVTGALVGPCDKIRDTDAKQRGRVRKKTPTRLSAFRSDSEYAASVSPGTSGQG